MNIVRTQNLACPLDNELLVFQDRQLVCQSGHCYDISKHGYINLLPVQYKRSKQPGDSKEMVVARSQFFESGLYQPIAQRLSALTLQYTGNQAISNILDAGCGEGYYLNELLDRITASEGTHKYSLIGLDISKPAILCAAKTNRQITWVVGTNRQPPVVNETLDVILCVFGFPCLSVFYNLLKPGGILILVDAGPDHLIELRNIIYPKVKIAEPPVSPETDTVGLKPIDTQQVRYECTLNSNTQINNLLLMTPHFHRAKKEGRMTAMNLDELQFTVDVKFTLLEKI